MREALNAPDRHPKGKVAVACFASNVARMDTVIRAAEANDRRVCLVGRSMLRMAAAARSVGLLQGRQAFVSDAEAGYFPDDKILYLCTGSQGEARAALSRIAEGTHPHVSLGKGDHCVFSSRVIPGNEVADPQPAEQARRPRRAPLHRARPSGHPRLRPPVPRRAEADVPVGAAADRRADPRRAPPPAGTRRARHATCRSAQASRRATATWCAWPPAAPRSSTRCPAGRLYRRRRRADARERRGPARAPARRLQRRAHRRRGAGQARAASPRDRRCARIGLPGDADYPLGEALDDLADEAETALKRLSTRRARGRPRRRDGPLPRHQARRLPHLGTPTGGGGDGA